jgi:hypothetical protein
VNWLSMWLDGKWGHTYEVPLEPPPLPDWWDMQVPCYVKGCAEGATWALHFYCRGCNVRRLPYCRKDALDKLHVFNNAADEDLLVAHAGCGAPIDLIDAGAL